MKTEILNAAHPIALEHAVDILKHGGLVAFPTDTVYGLAALPFHSKDVERLFAAKGRNSNRAIAILVGDMAGLRRVAKDLGEAARRLAERFWPGPLTLVVPRHSSLPEELTQNDTVGVRMPDHPVALALLKKIGPLAVTSANLSGKENPITAEDVMQQLNGRIHLVLDGGAAPGKVPSTVVDCTSEELLILREGPLSLSDLKAALADSA